MMKHNVDNCKVEAKIVSGEVITFEIKYLRYDSNDDIYWYEDKALKDIKIITPENKKPRMNVFV
jgi:hypothetical protein